MASPCRETAALKLQPPGANVADTSHGEIKANRVRTLTAIRHCSAEKIDMQIYAQILVISLTRPAALATAQRADGIPVGTLAPFAPLIHPISFSSPLSLPRPVSIRIVSLCHSVCDAHFSSENTFFPSRRAPVARQDCDRGLTGGRWVRGYKTGLARV